MFDVNDLKEALAPIIQKYCIQGMMLFVYDRPEDKTHVLVYAGSFEMNHHLEMGREFILKNIGAEILERESSTPSTRN